MDKKKKHTKRGKKIQQVCVYYGQTLAGRLCVDNTGTMQ